MLKALTLVAFAILFSLSLAAQQSYSSLEFIQNKGQWDSDVIFKGNLTNGAFFLRNTGFTVVQHHPDDMRRIADISHADAAENKKPQRPVREGYKNETVPPPDSITVRSNAYTMNFVNANEAAIIHPAKPAEGYNNYFIGDDSSKWRTNCGIFQEIIYENIYPGIDVKYYTESGDLKYEFIIHPGADPSQIAMKFDGVNKLSISKNQLIITTSVGEVKELSPYTYQSDINGRKQISCRYEIQKNNIVRFNIKDYDADQLLIIDPTLVFAALSGSLADNWGYTATYGPGGVFFAGGIVFGTGYQVSPGAYQTSFGGDFDMGIMKFSSNGAQRLYATYIGGNKEDQPHSMFCDQSGNLVIAGRTNSTTYPLTGPSYQFAGSNGLGGYDIVVTKLNAAGNALIGSARIGGTGNDGINVRNSHGGGVIQTINNYGDDARSEVILDGAGNIYVASCTQSGNFYTTPNAVQTSLRGSQDAVLLKLSPDCSSVLYSSYIGGNGYDAGFVLALNPANSDIYLAGATTSADFPGNTAGTIHPSFQGGRTDGFIAVFSNNGSVLRQSTYIGTAGVDFVFGIQFDKNAFPYVMGTTSGVWNVVNAPWSIPGSKQFVGKLNKDLSGWQYTTTFGSSNASGPNISPVAFLVDRCENVYVSGWGKDFTGGFSSIGTQGMPTKNPLQSSTDNHDFYFIVIQRDAADILYGTFFGENNSYGGIGEHVDGGTSRYDQNGVIYQAVCANCGQPGTKPRWPVTPGVWCCSSGYAPSSLSGCNVGAIKIAFNFAGVGSFIRPLINGVLDSIGCVPLTIDFRDTIKNAVSYEWNFGDGSPDVTTTDPFYSHTYTSLGQFRARLIAIDPNSCNIRDTSYITVTVKDNKANLAWTFQKPDCQSLDYTFLNNSVPPAGSPFTNTSFIWNFGDGTRTAPMGIQPISHTYAAAGVYPVSLVLIDTTYCNAPDSLTVQLRVSPNVKAQFETPSTGCAPYEAFFNNTSLGGQTFFWDFGDGNTSTDINPSHIYNTPGTYTVTLQATDPATCNLVDDTTMDITISPSPTAVFTVTPQPPIENTINVFTNHSSFDAIRFKWDFGDGDTLITISRSPVEHQYNETFTFQACLIAYNQNGCTDTACQPVSVIVSPRLDMPNAFTPLGPAGTNVVYVRGYAIGKVNFIIYNRQGKKVFQTNDRNQGWDGRYKGALQPMDVYAYTLEVQFTDGTKATKKGDITLIR